VDCNEVLQQLSDYLDPDAREELCRAIQEHLSQCHDCRFYVDTVKKTIVLYQNEGKVEMPAGVSTRLAAALAKEYGSERGS
jgi:predicted anti-sigma-YlaC factor YlaD